MPTTHLVCAIAFVTASAACSGPFTTADSMTTPTTTVASSADFSRIHTGQRAEIKGVSQADGSVLATRITLEDD